MEEKVGIRLKFSAREESGQAPDGIGQWLAQTTVETSNTESIHVFGWRLKSVSQRAPLGQYLQEAWSRRHFVIADARGQAFQSARGTFLGQLWLVMYPFLNSLVYYLIFGIILHTSRGIENFPAYLVIGVNFFAPFRNALTSGSAVIAGRGSRNLIRSFSFPRITVMMSWIVRQFYDFIPIFFATLVFLIVVPPHSYPNLGWVLILPILIFGFVFSLGLALLTAAFTQMLPDLKFVWPLISRFWFYISGVFFSMNMLDSLPVAKSLMQVNPAYVYLSMCRDLLIYNTIPSYSEWFYLASWSLLLTGAGIIVFWLREDTYGRQR